MGGVLLLNLSCERADFGDAAEAEGAGDGDAVLA